MHDVLAKLKACGGEQLWSIGTSHSGAHSAMRDLAVHWGKEEAVAKHVCKVLQRAKGCTMRFTPTVATSSPALEQKLDQVLSGYIRFEEKLDQIQGGIQQARDHFHVGRADERLVIISWRACG